MSEYLNPSPLLRAALYVDAAVSAVAGILSCVFSAPLATALGVPVSWALALGLFMLGYGALLGACSRSGRFRYAVIRIIVYGNAMWVLASLALLASSWIDPDKLGVSLILAQAVVVAVFTERQFRGWKQSPGAATA